MHARSSRRSFLKQFAIGVSAGLPVAATTDLSVGASPGVQSPRVQKTADWDQVRAEFSFRESMVPMNAGNLCPPPRVVAERFIELTRDVDADVSYANRAKFGRLREESRAKVAAHLGVAPDEIALVRNTTEANGTIIGGLPLKRGDEVVLWDQNHPTNNVAWDVLAARLDLNVTRLSTPAVPRSPDQLVDLFASSIGPRTRVLALTHVANFTGIRLPIEAICEVARRREVHVHLDGAQSWGALRVNLRDIGCDSFSASCHKWLCGPKEAGILYVRADRIEEIWPHTVGFGWGTDIEPGVVGARKFESLGQRDDACLAAVGTTIDFHTGLGVERIEARMYELNRTGFVGGPIP